MIVLDTNVISELTRQAPDPGVVAWIRGHRSELVTTTVTLWELLYGIQRLPDGRRRAELERDAQRLVRSMRSVLPFDAPAAEEAARPAGSGKAPRAEQRRAHRWNLRVPSRLDRDPQRR